MTKRLQQLSTNRNHHSARIEQRCSFVKHTCSNTRCLTAQAKHRSQQLESAFEEWFQNNLPGQPGICRDINPISNPEKTTWQQPSTLISFHSRHIVQLLILLEAASARYDWAPDKRGWVFYDQEGNEQAVLKPPALVIPPEPVVATTAADEKLKDVTNVNAPTAISTTWQQSTVVKSDVGVNEELIRTSKHTAAPKGSDIVLDGWAPKFRLPTVSEYCYQLHSKGLPHPSYSWTGNTIQDLAEVESLYVDGDSQAQDTSNDVEDSHNVVYETHDAIQQVVPWLERSIDVVQMHHTDETSQGLSNVSIQYQPPHCSTTGMPSLSMTSIQAVLNTTGQPIPAPAVFMAFLSADSAALGLWRGGRLERHKVLTGYTIRRCQGKSQAKHERQGGLRRGAGAALRAKETIRLWNEVRDYLVDWQADIQQAALWFKSGDVRVWSMLYDTRPSPPINRQDERWHAIGYGIPKPRLRDIQDSWHRLSWGQLILRKC